MSPASDQRRVRAVLLDVGNTLMAPHPSVPHVVRDVLAEAGHHHDLAAIDALMPIVDAFYEDRYRDDDSFWADDGATSEVWVGMYSLLCRRLGIDQDAEAIAARVYDVFGTADHWRVYDDVVPFLERIRSRGIAVGIVSNWDARLAGILAGAGLAPYLDTVVSSAEVGLHKPDPRIFELALQRLDVAPAEALHVGDHHYADYVGATAVGCACILIDRHGLGCSAPNVRVVTSFDEILT